MKIDTLLKNGKDFFANSEYIRILKGNQLTINKVPYTNEIYKNLIKYFSDTEEYEKCITLKNLQGERFDHEIHYTLN
jgi:hypothetical protein